MKNGTINDIIFFFFNDCEKLKYVRTEIHNYPFGLRNYKLPLLYRLCI